MKNQSSPSVTFVHTADWQLGKPFAGVKDDNKRASLQNQRFAVIRRIADLVQEKSAQFVVVAGDLFDSTRATKVTVSQACGAIGDLGVPVYAIPGNHDHGGDGALWNQEFFLKEARELAPNLHVLDQAAPVELENVILLPCPLLRRHESRDPTEWLRSVSEADLVDKPRVVIAHGSVHDFGGQEDDGEHSSASNLLDLSQLPEEVLDYIALGDWHGTNEVSPKAWYSGTPEQDRFAKSNEHRPGHTLVVTAGRGLRPVVESVKTGKVDWHKVSFTFSGDESLEPLRKKVSELIGQRAGKDLMCLRLEGSLGLEASMKLESMIESWESRLIRLKLINHTTRTPTPDEIALLSDRIGDPLIANVASKLHLMAESGGDDAIVAQDALRQLYSRCTS